MIHVMNPYQMTLAMLRLTSFGFEYQSQMMQALTKMAMGPLAGVTQDEEEAGAEPEKRPVRRRSATARQPVKSAAPSRGARKAATAATRKTRKPSAPPAMPEPAGSLVSADDDDAAENMPV